MIITLTNAMDALTNPIDDSLMIQTETGKVQNMDLVNKKKTPLLIISPRCYWYSLTTITCKFQNHLCF